MKRKNPAEIVVLSNPRGRRRHRGHHRVRRRNPSMGGIFGSVIPLLKEGAIGAGGALLNDVAYGFGKKFLPDALQSGWGRTGTKLGFAVLLGLVAGKVFPGQGRALAAGAATVTLHEAATSLMNQMAPSVPLGAYEDNLLGYDDPAQQMGAYMRSGSQVGAYMSKGSNVGDLLPS